MRSSEFNQRVTVYSRAVTKTAGEQTETFASVGTFWAKARPVRATERVAGGIEFYTDAYRFSFRRNDVTSAITPDYRVIWGSTTYDVRQGPAPDGRDPYVEIVAEAVTPSTNA